jgi:hypothetical protein
MESIFNIASTRVTLGRVIARGSPGITLYEAELVLGEQIAKVQIAVCNSSSTLLAVSPGHV